MSYWAIVSRNHSLADPWTVVRGSTRDEESLSLDLEWSRSDTIYRIDSGRDDREYLPVTEDYVKWFEDKIAERAGAGRAAEPKWGPEYYYWARVLGRFTLDDPKTVIRADGHGGDPREFTRNLAWESCDPYRLARLMGNRGPDNDAVLITAADAERFERIQAARVRDHVF